MYLNLLLQQKLHSQRFCFKCFGPFRIPGRRHYSGILVRPAIIQKNSIATYVKSYKYFPRLLKKSTINDFEILQRSLTTSSCLFNDMSNPENKNPDSKRNKEMVALFWGITVFLLLSALSMKSETNVEVNISWEEFKHEMLAKGEVKSLFLDVEKQIVYIQLHEGAIVKGNKVNREFYRMIVPEIKKFEEKLRAAEKELGISPQDSLPVIYMGQKLRSFMLTAILLLILWLLFSSKTNLKTLKPELWGFTKAKFTLVDPLTGKGKGVKFSDVAGLKEAKTEIMDFVDYLKRPEVYRNLGAKVPKGALLLGPPGCGKTLLAKAVATEANVPFLSMNGSEFIEIIGGLGAARVRDLFKEAKKRIPCIIYIDEIDAIGKKRESQANFGVGEVEQTLNQLLVEMDGVLSNQGVVLLASTNRGDVLDAALLRPGRFDRKILIDLPTLKEREEIFEQHLKSIRLEYDPGYYSKRMAHLTPGFSGADIANVCNEAALHAARIQKDIVQGTDLEYAVERVVGGTEKRSSVLSQEERNMLAYYEAGRALIGWLSKYGEALLKITIVSRTDSPAGWTHFSPVDKHLYSQEDLKGKMCMGLGGRAAVALMFNRITTAGEKDLKKVTKLAYAQVREFGMNSNVGLMSFDVGDRGSTLTKPYSKALGSVFDQEARTLVTEAHKEAESILLENKDKLIKLAEELLAKETLNYEDVVKLLGPPLFKGKKLVEPLEFELSLDQAAGPEPDTSSDTKNP